MGIKSYKNTMWNVYSHDLAVDDDIASWVNYNPILSKEQETAALLSVSASCRHQN